MKGARSGDKEIHPERERELPSSWTGFKTIFLGRCFGSINTVLPMRAGEREPLLDLSGERRLPQDPPA